LGFGSPKNKAAEFVLGAFGALVVAFGLPVLTDLSMRESGRVTAARKRLQSAEAWLARDLSGRADFVTILGDHISVDEAKEYGDVTDDKNIPKVAETREDRLGLSALWEVTHSRLDLYHQIATGQARRSFFTAQLATGIGFVLLVLFAVLATRTRTTVGAVTTGTLGAVSAALAGYIGRTFVRSQESAAGHLRAYFDQPLEFSRYLAAERLLGGTPDLDTDQRTALLTAIVTAMVAVGSSTPRGDRPSPSEN
jgi:hypothetical protein